MLVKVFAKKEFSSTVFGNVNQGQELMISPERKKVWVEQGLVEAEKIDVSKMDKDELEAFAKERFDIDLDKRSSLKSLREDVAALLEVTE